MSVIDYAPILIVILLASGLAMVFWLGSILLGPSHKNKVKGAPFECGHPSSGNPGRRFSVKFYSVAILIILFDIEAVFLFPWAVSFGSIGIVALISMGFFIGILFLALFYAWAKGGLEWD
jgi:NADH-quinone oxidoreductase subunit A